jgi:hypothetical protein
MSYRLKKVWYICLHLSLSFNPFCQSLKICLVLNFWSAIIIPLQTPPPYFYSAIICLWLHLSLHNFLHLFLRYLFVSNSSISYAWVSSKFVCLQMCLSVYLNRQSQKNPFFYLYARTCMYTSLYFVRAFLYGYCNSTIGRHLLLCILLRACFI